MYFLSKVRGSPSNREQHVQHILGHDFLNLQAAALVQMGPHLGVCGRAMDRCGVCLCMYVRHGACDLGHRQSIR